ncbi:MAG: DUF262 domain-containing protein [Verrucomicrobiaceae bacterium]|nr:MAG: DUF262 domain-containing protein [Verrucomicrobiaceae bacterium]
MDQITIREILDMVIRGQIRIPAFQRGFVWEPDRVAYLMDSIYKGYPFGSLLFWRTKEVLRAEKDLGPFKLPEPSADYPVDYVLDGQQRITSIFGVFQTELKMQHPEIWKDVYFDLLADTVAQESQFVALPKEEVNPERHFPLNTFFDTIAYRRATKKFDDILAKKIDDMQSAFKEVRIPVQSFKTEDKATVAIIFERVNRQGVPLDTLQLLSAWTWSEEFQLQEQFRELTEHLEPFGFKEFNTELLLRCCSAVLVGDASPDALMQLNGPMVRSRFSEVVNGIKGAIDYLRNSFSIHSLDNLPFTTLVVPLSVFFSIEGTKERHYSDKQRKALDRWFWRAAFSRRYSSGVLRTLKTDIEEMAKLRDNKPSTIGEFHTPLGPDFFTENKFGMSSVNTKTFILMLANNHPLSFVSGTPISLGDKLRASNRTEFHHLMPKAFLEATKQLTFDESCLANFCFMSRAENRHLGGTSPSLYKHKMAANIDEVLARALCPKSLFSDRFETFIKERSVLLHEKAKQLLDL